MPLIKTDYSNTENREYTALPTDEYEMVIEDVVENATKNGAETLQLKLRVRKDLDKALPETNGKHHNRIVFMDNWKRKESKDYDWASIQNIFKAVGTDEGKEYNTIDDVRNALIGKPAKVYVKEEENTYNGETRMVNRVAPWNFSETAYPMDPNANEAIEVKEEDLPF
ncbi:DUF669 domain-containing protein [Lactobacillus terrae]|uniref:DUF669 domain-containing protein n=1 Tax=Lactobacillus terrae TaxID=2269374 RepID=UPI000C1B6F14|nr:DUF669 domain-containing protein [Lactobacillus terrae]